MRNENQSQSRSNGPSNSSPSLKNKIVDGFVWFFTGTVVQTLFKFIVLVVLARLLSPREFGIIGAATVVVTFSQVFGQLGIGQGVVQKKELNPAHIKISAFLAIGLGLFTSLVVYNLADYFALFFRMEELGEVVQIISFVFPITAISVVSESLLQREMKYKFLAAIETITYFLAYVVIGVSLAYLGWGVWSLVIALISHAAIKSVILYCSRPYVLGIVASASTYSGIFRFGWKYSFGHVANHIASQMDNIVVGRYLGAEFLGYYTRAYQAVTMPTKLVGRVAHMVLFPAMASVQSDQKKLKKTFTHSISIVGLCAVPLSVVFCLLAEQIVTLILGNQWIEVVVPFQILSIAIIFRVAYKVCESLSRAKAALIEHAVRQWLFALAVFLGAWLGHFWELKGVAIGVSIAITFNYLLMLHLCLKLTHTSWSEIFYVHIRHAALAIILGIPVWVLSTSLGKLNASDLTIIMSCGFAIITAILLLLKFAPQIFGREGQSVFSIVQNYVPGIAKTKLFKFQN